MSGSIKLEISKSRSDSLLDEKPHVDEDPEVIEHVVHNEDEALKYVDEEYRGKAVPEHIARNIRRKADLYISTFVSLIWMMNYIDKVTISNGVVMGLEEDLDMLPGNGHGHNYSWQGSAFYLAYLIFEIPIPFVLQKVPVGPFFGVCVALWGVVCACNAAVQNYVQFIALRTLQGALESVVTPCLLAVVAPYYTKDEHFARTCLWLTFNGIGVIFCDAVSYGLYIHQDSLAIHGWRVDLIIFGAITIVLGLIAIFHLPKNPSEAWFFTEEERKWQLERTRANQKGYGSRRIKLYQIWEALLDPPFWLNCIAVLVNCVSNGATTSFSVQLLDGLGYKDDGVQLLMDMPNGAVEFASCLILGVMSCYFWHGYRMVYILFSTAVMLFSLCLLAWCPNDQCKLSGYYLSSLGGNVSYVGMLSVIESNVTGYTKALFSGSVFAACYAAGNLIGPQTFLESEYPTYETGKAVMAATAAVQLLLMLLLLAWYIWQNYRKDKKNEVLPPEIKNPEFLDLTDRENPEFRYAL